MRINRPDLIRHVAAAAIVLLLCLPSLRTVESYPSAADLSCYRIAIAVAAVAFLSALCAQRMPRLHILDGVVLLWMLYITVNYWFLSPYPAAEDFREAFVLFAAYVSLRLAIPLCGKAFGQAWSIGLCLTGLYQIHMGFAQLAGWETSRHFRYALTGTYFNPGPYSIAVVIAVAVAAARLYAHRGAWESLQVKDRLFRIGAYAVVCGGLPVLAATWSRTAWVALAVVAAGLLWRSHRRPVLWGLAAAACLGTAAYFMKQGSADGRVLMALVSGRAWLDGWLTGHGPGGFAHAYAEAQEAFFAARPDSPLLAVAGTPEYAFNGLLGIAVEQGVIGAACALLLSLWGLAVLWRRQEASAYGYMALLVASLFSYPFALWPFRLIAVGCTAHAASLQAGTARGSWWKKTAEAAVAASLAAGVFLFIPIVEGRVKAYKSYRSVAGIQDAAFIDLFRESHEALKDRPDYLFTYGSALRELKRYNDSNDLLRQGTQVSCDPMFYVVMGNNCLDLGAYREAEAAYRKAFNLLPGRIYPLYRLMKLYEATGETVKMQDMARRIAGFRVKIASPATRKIKEEAKEVFQ